MLYKNRVLAEEIIFYTTAYIIKYFTLLVVDGYLNLTRIGQKLKN
jgi:hypothetical protein